MQQLKLKDPFYHYTIRKREVTKKDISEKMNSNGNQTLKTLWTALKAQLKKPKATKRLITIKLHTFTLNLNLQ